MEACCILASELKASINWSSCGRGFISVSYFKLCSNNVLITYDIDYDMSCKNSNNDDGMRYCM